MEYFAALLPSVGVGVIFWCAMRALLNSDRREREAQALARQQSDMVEE